MYYENPTMYNDQPKATLNADYKSSHLMVRIFKRRLFRVTVRHRNLGNWANFSERLNLQLHLHLDLFR